MLKSFAVVITSLLLNFGAWNRGFDHSVDARHSTESPYFKSPWSWSCVNTAYESYCQKEYKGSNITEAIPLGICWLTCGTHGPLWPYPTGTTHLGKTVVPFYPDHAEIKEINARHKGAKAMLGYAGNIFLDYLFRMHPKSEGQSAFPTISNGKGIEKNTFTIILTITSPDTRMKLTTDESYTISIDTVNQKGGAKHVRAHVSGATFFGVRHGLESLSQLIAFDEENECLQILSTAVVNDEPVFKYRGVMIDTSRNFIPVSVLKRVVDAMSYNKLNFLHWHMTDSNSFPFYSKRVPQMAQYGAYSPSKIYTPKDIRDLVLYAKLRGVKIIPELDAPAHAGNGWQWGEMVGFGEMALCVNADPWRNFCGQPPCGQLNPLNNNTYLVLGEIYKDMLEVFEKDLFHMGADEVYYSCWLSSNDIQKWQRENNNYDLLDLWAIFQNKAYSKLKEANEGNPITPIIWTSEMTKLGRHYLDPNDYIIQIWTSSMSAEVGDLLKDKYRVIFSNSDAAYLDHGFGTWLGPDQGTHWTLKSWKHLYDNDLYKIADYHMNTMTSQATLEEVLDSKYQEKKRAEIYSQILGAEATLWGEKMDSNNIEMKLWPRCAALAERLWSNPEERSGAVLSRLNHHRERMADRGIHPDRLQPESCHQYQGRCTDPHYRN